MRNFRFLSILLTALLLMVPAALSMACDDLSFADSLAGEGDHYRAITEYKRFVHYHPEDTRAAYAQLQIGRSLIAGERWLKADLALKNVWQRYPGSTEAAEARKLYADAAYKRGDYEEASRRYTSLKWELSDEQGLRRGITELHLGRPNKASQIFDLSADPQLRVIPEQFEQLPTKSPQLAATLSAILPGAGQLYTERPRQAGVAFALNAAFIYAAVESWENDNHAVSAILSLFELGWYGGNIYNAINNAHKYNKRQKQNFIERLQERFDLSLGWRNDYPEVTARARF